MLSSEVCTNNRRRLRVDIRTFALHIHFDSWRDESTQLSDPVNMFVANVSDQTESSPVTKNTCDLRASHFTINPVPSSRDHSVSTAPEA